VGRMNVTLNSVLSYITRCARETGSLLLATLREFSRQRSLEACAAISFYALFSLFPVVIFLITILGFFFDQHQVQVHVLLLLGKVLPAVRDDVTRVVNDNLSAVFSMRGSISILAAIGLLWAGSSVFHLLVTSINKAWHTTASHRSFIRSRLVALIIISIFAAIVLFSFFSTTIFNLIGSFDIPVGRNETISGTPFGSLSNFFPYLYSFVLFLALYRWVPNAHVPWIAGLVGAFIATVAWRGAIVIFTWMIKGGVLNYKVIYGSLTTILVIMMWTYISSLIVLFGAHLSAALTWRLTRRERT
jgi:membrane protein